MPRKPNQRKEYTAHYRRVERYAALVDSIYKQATDEFAKLALAVDHDPSKAFKWSDYPQTKRRVDQLLRGVSDNIQGVVVNGVAAEWGESNFKNDRLARSVIGIKQFDKDDKGRDIIPERFKPYFNNNADALRSFVGRKQKGLNLSQKVWKLSEQYKSDLELALSVGLSDGRSAAELSRDIRSYLKEPAGLFRRVRSENGSLQLSKAAKAYHPGAGTYRSSYKNAMRLTRTEINMAYRTADGMRWGQMDFVVGFEVKRSGRGYDCSVCEALAGKYPKDFKFVGWHPHCRCYVIPILKTDEEFWAWDGRGESPTSSIKEVKEVPSGFKDWISKNSDRIATAEKNGTLPYFLRDNAQYQKSLRTLYTKNAQPVTTNTNNINLNDTLQNKISALVSKNPSFFGNSDLDVRVVVNNDFFMGAEPLSRQLFINNRTYTFDGVKFNPAVDLNNALDNIRAKKQLNFSQEYAIESLWHEILHLQSKGWRDYMLLHSVANVDTMETLNQFCARMSYDKLMKKLGGTSSFQNEIFTSGFGYKNEVKRLVAFLDHNNITKAELFKTIYPKMKDAYYEDLPFILNAFFVTRGVDHKIVRQFLML